MTETRTAKLSSDGVSIWLDDLSRERIYSGGLTTLIAERNVVGITTNPTIFANALAKGDAYDAQIAELARAGASVEETVFELTTDDVARACEIFRPVYERTNGVDGRVSIEVGPSVAHDVAGTIAEAHKLSEKVDRPGAYIKVPATLEGVDAIAELTASGISINVTLIFSLDRYRAVIDAYLSGLERAQAAGIDIRGIHSVASFFVSRVDTEVNKRLDGVGTDAARTLRSKAGIANARLAYRLCEQSFATDRARALLDAGANLQRPLWASTGVKDPALPDTTYVVELVAPGVVNTMPEKTLQATFDHAELRGDTVTAGYDEAQAVLDGLDALGISYDDVTATLEKQGIDTFVASWGQLLDTVQVALDSAREMK